MTRLSGDTGTRSALCPKPRTRGDKPQGFESPIKICDLVAADWWAPQTPTTSVEECVSPSPRLVRLFLTPQPQAFTVPY
ncbi:MAG: hypothetical protein QNJ51_18560 [Calothrix sp. MO_167.B12]|nr:hypothetical protein [Calothrix sp. MO_167.B12]